MPNTVLGSGNSVVDQDPHLMEFTFWWGDDEQYNMIFGIAECNGVGEHHTRLKNWRTESGVIWQLNNKGDS